MKNKVTEFDWETTIWGMGYRLESALGERPKNVTRSCEDGVIKLEFKGELGLTYHDECNEVQGKYTLCADMVNGEIDMYFTTCDWDEPISVGVPLAMMREFDRMKELDMPF